MAKEFVAALLMDSSESFEEQSAISRMMALKALDLEKVYCICVVLEFEDPEDTGEEISFKIARLWKSPNEDSENDEEMAHG